MYPERVIANSHLSQNLEKVSALDNSRLGRYRKRKEERECGKEREKENIMSLVYTAESFQ